MATAKTPIRPTPTSAWPTRPARRIPGLDSRRALRSGCADRQGVVVERRPDHVVEPLERSFDRQWPRLHRHLRQQSVLLRDQEVTGPHVEPMPVWFMPGDLACRRPSPQAVRVRLRRRSLQRQRQLLLDWAGLTRYGSEDTRDPASQSRAKTGWCSWATRSPKQWGAGGNGEFFPG